MESPTFAGFAGHSIRGYRRQFLHTLTRLTSLIDGTSLRLEGFEDFDVLRNGDVIETVQIKDRSNSLTVSDLLPFFKRSSDSMNRHQFLMFFIASFGPIGPSLIQAVEEPTAMGNVHRQIASGLGLKDDQVIELLSRTRVLKLSEEEQIQKCIEFLVSSPPAADPRAALELLLFWILKAAETGQCIDKTNLIDEIHNVGRFVTTRLHQDRNWGTVIEPLDYSFSEEIDREKVAADYFQGVGANYQHILADCDVPRPEIVATALRELAQNQVVVFHGASGQGKSTQALRFLHDQAGLSPRLLIRHLSSPEHALEVALALDGFGTAIQRKVWVCIDTPPGNTNWLSLVERMRTRQWVYLIVCVREEDLNLVPLQQKTQMGQVSMSFARPEAERIFGELWVRGFNNQFLSFEDAWIRFGEQGPLLEFIYLVTHGAMLHERLFDQVTQIRDEVNTGARHADELLVLRVMSFASQFGSRLSVRRLRTYTTVPDLDRVLHKLENEFWLRRVQSDDALEAVHPLRSQVLTDIFSNEFRDYDERVAQTALAVVLEEDLGQFLINLFASQPGSHSKVLLALAAYRATNWNGVAGVFDALLWLGIRRYAVNCRELIASARNRFGRGWMAVLDIDIAQVSAASSEQRLFDLLEQSRGKEMRIRRGILGSASPARRRFGKRLRIGSKHNHLSCLGQRPMSNCRMLESYSSGADSTALTFRATSGQTLKLFL